MENQTQDNYSSINSSNLQANVGEPVILVNHDAVPSTPLAPANPPTSSNKNLSKTLLISALSLILIVAAVLVGIEIGKNQSLEEANDLALNEELVEMESPITSSPSPSKVVTSPATSPTVSNSAASESAALETHQDMAAGFSIKYPAGWRKVAADNWVGFGPKEIGEDVAWAVSFYKNSEKTAAQVKDEAGKQFADRVQTEKKITINGLEATEVITTTESYPDWHLVTIVVDDQSGLFEIGNGAQTDAALNKMIEARTGKEFNLSFEDFYSSFRVY